MSDLNPFIKVYLKRDEKEAAVDISDVACSHFGFKHGDAITSPRGRGLVAGVFEGKLWFQLERDEGKISYWGQIQDYESALRVGILLCSSSGDLGSSSFSSSSSSSPPPSSYKASNPSKKQKEPTPDTPSPVYLPESAVSLKTISLSNSMMTNYYESQLKKNKASILAELAALQETSASPDPSVIEQLVASDDPRDHERLLQLLNQGKNIPTLEELLKQRVFSLIQAYLSRAGKEEFQILSIGIHHGIISIYLHFDLEKKGLSKQSIASFIFKEYRTNKVISEKLLATLYDSSVQIEIYFRGENELIYSLKQDEIKVIQRKLSFLSSEKNLLSSNLYLLCASRINCDITLFSTDQAQVKCHKLVLFARCSSLRNTIENYSNISIIVQDEKQLNAFVKYLYGVHSSQDLKLLSPESQNLVDVTLSEGLRYCRDNNIFCDAQINCSTGKPINAHKIILSASSDYFSNLYSERWNSNNNNMNFFPSSFLCDYEVGMLMINWIYGLHFDEMNIPNNLLIDLFEMADFYQISGLRSYLRSVIGVSLKNIHPLNLAKLFCLVDCFDEKSFSQKIMEALTPNLDIFISHPSFTYMEPEKQHEILKKKFPHSSKAYLDKLLKFIQDCLIPRSLEIEKELQSFNYEKYIKKIQERNKRKEQAKKQGKEEEEEEEEEEEYDEEEAKDCEEIERIIEQLENLSSSPFPKINLLNLDPEHQEIFNAFQKAQKQKITTLHDNFNYLLDDQQEEPEEPEEMDLSDD